MNRLAGALVDVTSAPLAQCLPAAVAAQAALCLDRASEHAVGTRDGDGAWYVPSEPRILENAVVACSLAGVERAQAARARAVRWLAHAEPQTHSAFVAAADRWLVELSTDPRAPVFVGLSAHEGPHARRALYLQALACAQGAPGADTRRLLDHAAKALGPDHGNRLKPWQRTLLLAFETLARCVLDMPVPPHYLKELALAQCADGSFYGMPMVTGMLHLALNRAAPDHPATRRCLESLLADQRPDGTWRFLVSEVWDTGLMVRALRGHPRFDAVALAGCLEFLASAQNEDGGWACTAPLDSDNDTTGNTLLALAATPWADRIRAGATRYARRHQTSEGLWTTWHSRDDTPVPDVVAHMVAGISAAALPGIDLAPARAWLAGLCTDDGWDCDWYIPPAYGAAEIGAALAPDAHSRTVRSALLASQRADGGWPRIAGEPCSSPTATGLALTALTAGHHDIPHDALERAVRFLIDTQTDTGTWSDRPVMYGPRPFLTVTTTQVHALAARGLHDVLTRTNQEPRPC